jgi:hypothetical protein
MYSILHNYSLFIIHYSLFIIHYSLFIIRTKLSIKEEEEEEEALSLFLSSSLSLSPSLPPPSLPPMNWGYSISSACYEDHTRQCDIEWDGDNWRGKGSG